MDYINITCPHCGLALVNASHDDVKEFVFMHKACKDINYIYSVEISRKKREVNYENIRNN